MEGFDLFIHEEGQFFSRFAVQFPHVTVGGYVAVKASGDLIDVFSVLTDPFGSHTEDRHVAAEHDPFRSYGLDQFREDIGIRIRTEIKHHVLRAGQDLHGIAEVFVAIGSADHGR